MPTPTFSKTLVLALLPLLPTTASADWSGNYGGLSIGQLSLGEITLDAEGDSATLDVESDAMFGGFYGYQIQRGDFVYGGEVAYTAPTAAELSFEGDTLDTDVSFIDVKARAGYAIDKTLVYGVLGVSRGALTPANGIDLTADGFNFGIGADYMINDQFVIGAEYLARRLSQDDIIGSGLNSETSGDTLSIRASYKF